MKKQGLVKFIGSIAVLATLVFVLPTFSNAAVVQSNPTTGNKPTEKTLVSWMPIVRNMETAGAAMGLAETINSSTYAGTTTSNGLDVHMMKTTEYGAMAILSASGFGNPSTAKNIDWSSGNKTGVYMNEKASEWAAGGGSSAPGLNGSILHRYYNSYTTSKTSRKPGDALDLWWHEASGTGWITQNNYVYRRGGPLGVFGYNYQRPEYDPNAKTTRAVVVNGIGF